MYVGPKIIDRHLGIFLPWKNVVYVNPYQNPDASAKLSVPDPDF